MCRLLMANKEGMVMLEKNIGIERMLDHLEKQCGGHGNGFALVKAGKVTFVKKGVDYTNKQITRRIMNSDFDYCMYHTRVASVSGIKDSNCHPFYTKNRDFVLMMNGTEREIGKLSAPIGITDTEMVFRMIRDYNIPLKSLEEMSARYMGFRNGKVFICNTTYSGLEFIREKNAFVVASSFPNMIASKSMKAGLWVQGETISERYAKSYTTYGSGYGSGYSYNGVKKDTTPGQPRVTTVERMGIGGALVRPVTEPQQVTIPNNKVGAWWENDYTDDDYMSDEEIERLANKYSCK